MNDENESDAFAAYAENGDAPLPNRLNRSTFVGCAGILGVLTLPLVLALPLVEWGVARWAYLLIHLLAFAAVSIGALLLARVPTAALRSLDPEHPLTRAGESPVVERPARLANRVVVLGFVVPCMLVIAGFSVAAFAVPAAAALLIGTLLACGGSLSLVVLGMLVAQRLVPPPALLWVHVPIEGRLLRPATPFLAVGLPALGWSLLTAAFAGEIWGGIGLAVVLLGAVLLVPLLRRLPPLSSARRRHRSGEGLGVPFSDSRADDAL